MQSKYKDITLQGIDPYGKKRNYSLNDFQGERVVLYFYPKNDGALCTKQACDFRDHRTRFPKNARIIGVSGDTLESHRNFHGKEGLNFILLSDPERKLAKALDVPVMADGCTERTTFLLDGDGNVEKSWKNVTVTNHVNDIIKTMRR